MKVPLLDLAEQNNALRPEIEAALGRVLDTNAFILGGEVKALEDELAEYLALHYEAAKAPPTDYRALAGALLLAAQTGVRAEAAAGRTLSLIRSLEDTIVQGLRRMLPGLPNVSSR